MIKFILIALEKWNGIYNKYCNYNNTVIYSWPYNGIKPINCSQKELASGWDFFRSPNPRDLGIGIILFWDRSKNPESPGIGIGIWKRYSDHRDFSEIFWKSGILSRGFEIFLNFGIVIPRIFPKSPEFGIFSGFFSLKISRGLFTSRLGFFRGMGYPDRKPTLGLKTG